MTWIGSERRSNALQVMQKVEAMMGENVERLRLQLYQGMSLQEAEAERNRCLDKWGSVILGHGFSGGEWRDLRAELLFQFRRLKEKSGFFLPK